MAPVNASSLTPKNIFFIAAEADPFIKVGGLGDVVGSLPLALRALEAEAIGGHTLDIRLALPFYPALHHQLPHSRPVAQLAIPYAAGTLTADVYQTTLKDDVPVYLVDGPPIHADPMVYGPDPHLLVEKFAFFSLAALELTRQIHWRPDVFHAHDWHAALVVHALRQQRKAGPFFAACRSLLSIHNLPYMGVEAQQVLEDYGLPPASGPRLPDWARWLPLPMGLAAADRIVAVSPTYAREITTPAFGCGLEKYLKARQKTLGGIVNGLDTSQWDPTVDKALVATFSSDHLEQRLPNKRALLEAFSLNPDPHLPLMIFIGRMESQKGIDLAIEGLRQVSGQPWQAIFLGTGDPALEAAVLQMEQEFPGRFRAAIRFDAQLARQMYAAADMLLMPSRYEPCGLAQMIAMRYGCIPVAHATGGLKDTIRDDPAGASSTGFLFDAPSAEGLAQALGRALGACADPDTWQKIQKNAMQSDFSWRRSALEYAHLYLKLGEEKP